MGKQAAAAPVSQQFLDEVRRHNLGHLLLALASDFEVRVLQRYVRIGYADIRPVHGAVLRNLEIGGTRLTALAHRAGMTHRAMAKIVADLQSRTYIERQKDPADARATLITYAPRGLQLLRDSRTEIDRIYIDYASLVGTDGLARLEEGLKLAIARLGIQVVRGGLQALEDSPASSPDRSCEMHLKHNLGRYLAELARDYEIRCKDIMHKLGHESIRFDHLAVLSHLDVAGADHSTLAGRAGISMQAIGKQVRALQRLGYVANEVDLRDRRVRRVSFSPRGYHFITDLLTAFQQIEYDYLEVIGRRNYRSLKKQLEVFAARLQLHIPVRYASA
ncbi:MAG: winged helix-turn-helix transcriptional regulator [Halioglobus sp.]|nr:winged helix-turn-helix transcriptional regulator [Halioglobus sp.]